MLPSFGIIIPIITSSLDLYFLVRIANESFVCVSSSYESHYIFSTYLLGFSARKISGLSVPYCSCRTTLRSHSASDFVSLSVNLGVCNYIKYVHILIYVASTAKLSKHAVQFNR